MHVHILRITIIYFDCKNIKGNVYLIFFPSINFVEGFFLSGAGDVRRASYDITTTNAEHYNGPISRSVSDSYSVTGANNKVLTHFFHLLLICTHNLLMLL